MAIPHGALFYATQGVPMSQSRKLLKVVSLIQVVLAIVGIVCGGMLVANGVSSTEEISVFGMTLSGMVYLVGTGICLIVSGALSLAGAMAGIRGANRPSSLGAHFGQSVSALAFGVVAAVLCTATALMAQAIASVVLAVLALGAAIFDKRCVKELDR